MEYLTITSPLDGNTPFFKVHQLEGTEELCGNYEYNLTLSSKKAIEVTQILGEKITVALGFSEEGKERYFNGVVVQMNEVDFAHSPSPEKQVFYYHCQFSSSFWELGITKESRIFYDDQNTTQSILTNLLFEYGISDIEYKCIRKYPFRPFCVMYDESVLNFFFRMLEREGISWYWKHEEKRHSLVLVDSNAQFPPCPDLSIAVLKKTGHGNWTQGDQIISLRSSSQIIPSGYELGDYNYQEPPRFRFEGPMKKGTRNLKIFEYPGDFDTLPKGKRRLKERMCAHEALQKRIIGKSYVRSFMVGHRFKLSAPDRPEDQKEFVLSKVKIMATQSSYENEFEAFPAELDFYPLPKTPRPQIVGTQTAIVVGEGKEENKTDGDIYGSVKVHFHWDRQSEPEEPWSSCPVRVASLFAGGKRGFVFTPHVGDEVVVSFENGDPERPIIIGSVFGPNSALPLQRIPSPRQSIIKTSSEEDSNQIKFEDKKEEELFYINAKKDHHINVQNDHQIHVWNDQKCEVKKQQSNHIQGRRETFIQKGDPEVDDKQVDHLVVEGNRKLAIHGKDSIETHLNEGKYEHTVEQDSTQTVLKNFVLTVEGDSLIIEAQGKGEGNVLIKGKSLSFESTEGNITFNAAKDVITDAQGDLFVNTMGQYQEEIGKDKMTKVAGASVIDIKGDSTCKAGGVLSSESSADVICKAGADLSLESGAALKTKSGAVTKISGSAGVVMKGATIKLN